MPSEMCSPDVPLSGDIDVDARIASIEEGFAVKGTFFTELCQRLGPRWETLRAELVAPPRLGRYVPFTSYPLGDYLRLVVAVARESHPGVSLREGIRLTARDDFRIFADTTFGKIALAAAGDPRSAMLAMGNVYTKMAPGPWRVVVTEVDERTLRCRWEGFPGIWEYQLGQTEGLALSYRVGVTIVVTELEPRRIQFDITLG